MEVESRSNEHKEIGTTRTALTFGVLYYSIKKYNIENSPRRGGSRLVTSWKVVYSVAECRRGGAGGAGAARRQEPDSW